MHRVATTTITRRQKKSKSMGNDQQRTHHETEKKERRSKSMNQANCPSKHKQRALQQTNKEGRWWFAGSVGLVDLLVGWLVHHCSNERFIQQLKLVPPANRVIVMVYAYFGLCLLLPTGKNCLLTNIGLHYYATHFLFHRTRQHPWCRVTSPERGPKGKS